MIKIFVSYSHADKEIVQPLVKKLQSLNYEVWMDTKDLIGGALWSPEIVKAIKASDYFLLFVSSASIKSDSVRREVDIAYKHKKISQIIPLCLEKVDIPTEWDYQTAGIQWIECGEPDWKKRLFNALKTPNENTQSDGNSECNSPSATDKKKKNNFNNKTLDQLEKELRMNKAHWINAGFSVPAKNFNFTVVYFENQIETLRNLREEISELNEQIQVKQVNPVYGNFLDRSTEILNRIETRCRQIHDILDDEDYHPLAITTKKALENLLEYSNNTKEQLMQSMVTWTANSSSLDNRLVRLTVEFQALIIASQELERQLEQINNLASSALSVPRD